MNQQAEINGNTNTLGTCQRGRVKMFDDSKGFGFITPDSGGQDVFFHRRDLANGSHRRTTIQLNTRVEFIVAENYRGPKASNVKPVAA